MLQIIYAPNDIFRQNASHVEEVNDDVRNIIDAMFEVLKEERAVGIAANMVGILKRIIVIDLHENNQSNPICMVNPEVVFTSDALQTFEEASLCFPGISAQITRPSSIKVKFIDYNNNTQEIEANGFFATVIQHEMDYLDGKTYLDYVSKMKRDLLINKMKKFIKAHPTHVHSTSCRH